MSLAHSTLQSYYTFTAKFLQRAIYNSSHHPLTTPSLTVWLPASSLYRNSFSQGHQCLPNCQIQQCVISPNSWNHCSIKHLLDFFDSCLLSFFFFFFVSQRTCTFSWLQFWASGVDGERALISGDIKSNSLWFFHLLTIWSWTHILLLNNFNFCVLKVEIIMPLAWKN